METIRLLVEENSEKLWRTFEGRALAGSLCGKFAMGVTGDRPGYKNMLVFQAASGKLVVYRIKYAITDEPGVIQIYSDFDALRTAIPAAAYDEAAVKAGRQAPVTYRELPLEGVE